MSTTPVPAFDAMPILTYLGLPEDYSPSPANATITFLTKHIRQLPPHLLAQFSHIASPKDRTVISVIRNRRLKYTNSNPRELRFAAARSNWPTLWEGRERRGQEEGEEEREWASEGFLQGSTKHVGNLGTLLGNYEEEREAERVRTIRRERAAIHNDFVPEEDSDSDEDENENPRATVTEEESIEDTKANFERLVRERFIYGLLEDIDYDPVDWDDQLDSDDDREAEERWFDEDSEDDLA